MPYHHERSSAVRKRQQIALAAKGYIHADGTFRLPLTRGKEAILDPDCYWMNRWAWSATRRPNADGVDTWYAVHETRWDPRPRTHHYMHREVLSAPRGVHVHHKNGNGLDNRRANLEIVTPTTHARQYRPRPGGKRRGSSQYRGVCWIPKRGKWLACITIDGRSVKLGKFDDERDAALAYDMAALAHYGEGAQFNVMTKL